MRHASGYSSTGHPYVENYTSTGAIAVYKTALQRSEPQAHNRNYSVESMLVQLEVEPSSNAGGWGDHSVRAWYTILFSGALGCVLSLPYKTPCEYELPSPFLSSYRR